MKKDDKNKEELKEYIDEPEDACEACGGELKAEKVNLEDYQGGKLYMMENVAAYVCQECGEIWVPEPLMEEFEKMIETAKLKGSKPAKNKKGRTNGNGIR